MPSSPQILFLALVTGVYQGLVGGALLNTQQPQGADQPNGTEANFVTGVAGAPGLTNSGRQSGLNPNNNNIFTGPSLNLVPGAYIQFKVAVPVGFYVQLDNTPDGGSLITVISPQLPCYNCDRKIESTEMESSKPGKAEEAQETPGNTPKYLESQVIPKQPYPSGNQPKEESNPPVYTNNGFSKQLNPQGFQPEQYPSESQQTRQQVDPPSQLTRQQVDPPSQQTRPQVDPTSTNHPSQINSFPDHHVPQLQPQDAHILPDGSFQRVTHNNPLAPSNPSAMQFPPSAPPNNLPVMQTLPPSNTPIIQHFPNSITRHYYSPPMQNFSNNPSEKPVYQSAVRTLDDARNVQEEG